MRFRLRHSKKAAASMITDVISIGVIVLITALFIIVLSVFKKGPESKMTSDVLILQNEISLFNFLRTPADPKYFFTGGFGGENSGAGATGSWSMSDQIAKEEMVQKDLADDSAEATSDSISSLQNPSQPMRYSQDLSVSDVVMSSFFFEEDKNALEKIAKDIFGKHYGQFWELTLTDGKNTMTFGYSYSWAKVRSYAESIKFISSKVYLLPKNEKASSTIYLEGFGNRLITITLDTWFLFGDPQSQQ